MIIWDDTIQAYIESHAGEAYPYECCGFLLGEEHGDTALVKVVLPAENTHNGEKRRRFLIDPVDFMKAEREALKKGFTLIGVYHSHPDHPAIPSEEDRKHALPGFHYPIVSVKKGQPEYVRSWLLGEERQFIEENISINQLKTSI